MLIPFDVIHKNEDLNAIKKNQPGMLTPFGMIHENG